MPGAREEGREETVSGQEGVVWGHGNALKLDCGGGDAELCKIC